MIIWIVEGGKLAKWERSGECNGCGECCTGHDIEFQWETQGAKGQSTEEDDWSEKEGWSALKSHGVWWWYKIYNIEDNEEQECGSLCDSKCEVWKDEIEFPPLCRYFPVNPNNLEHFQKCGFSFERGE